jgi:U4/U6 small nuclear ribonucleoprotein PRP3
MVKNSPLPQVVKRATNVAAPVPRVPVLPASEPSKVVYAVPPSPSVSGRPTPITPPTPASGSGTPAVGGSDDMNHRIVEARKRVAEAKTKLAVKDNPYMVCTASPSLKFRPSYSSPQSVAMSSKKKGPTPVVEPTQQGAGLKMAAHPLLLDQTPALPQSKKDRYKPMQPKFASIKANVRSQPSPSPAPVPITTPSPSANPYSAASNNANKESTGFEGAPRERAGKKFHFNPKGKYIAMADQMRQDHKLEALKQRIAESARKAGLDGDIAIEKAVKVCNTTC